MSEPSKKTVKQLFAECGNECAYPKCSTPMVDSDSGTILGQICHIMGKNPDGPRYDANQTDKERHGNDNLLLLCGVHHKIVDDDPDSYTVERLQNLKRDHLERMVSSKGPLIDDHMAQKAIEIHIENKGSTVISINQSGGQTAHSITNVSPPRRNLLNSTRQQMVQYLSQNQKGTVGFASTQGDVEAHQWKEPLMSVFAEAGWKV